MPEPDDTTAMLAAIARLRALITRNPIDFMAIYETTADEQEALIQALTGIAASLIEEHAAAQGLTPVEYLDTMARAAIEQSQENGE